MKDRYVRATVIGGGIHGLTSAIALAKRNVDVTIVEKNDYLLSGTSRATQNRAHLGYHYPRSIETARECRDGLRLFEERYPDGLAYPKEAYYLIEAESSKTSEDEFRAFCDTLQLPYKMQMPNNYFVNTESVASSFMVPEPVFDLNILSRLLREEALSLGIKLKMGSEVVGAGREGAHYRITTQGERGRDIFSTDVVLNATYSYANNVMALFGITDDLTKYRLQKTEVVVAESKIEVPALTIMDGSYVSILPFGHNPNLVLLYDVIHSVVDEEEGFFLDDSKKYPTNLEQMVEHGRKYYPFIDNLRYIDSLYGTRPIPKRIIGDSRKTRITSHNEAPGVYSILEGKFISSLLVADELVALMNDDGVLK